MCHVTIGVSFRCALSAPVPKRRKHQPLEFRNAIPNRKLWWKIATKRKTARGEFPANDTIYKQLAAIIYQGDR
jgi:hypothetical protein